MPSPWPAPNTTRSDGMAALEAAYARGESDEFVAPTVIGGGAPMRDGDAVVFMNFRADRARQLSSVFVRGDFSCFARQPRPVALRLPDRVRRQPARAGGLRARLPANTLPKCWPANGLTQLRIAETEKYAHVTFFFSGGREDRWPGEERILVPSPKVATYDLQPEMSCPEVTERLVEAIERATLRRDHLQLANPDMVGHTGDLQAAILAAQAIDAALGRIRAALEAAGGEMLLTADHGNLEMMRDESTGQAHTAHTTGPVPLVYLGRAARLAPDGALKDVAPSLLHLLGLPPPPQMGGRNLVTFD
jgi:2,3-bisphosphoglycerate-independent phosphoglycerate mutase